MSNRTCSLVLRAGVGFVLLVGLVGLVASAFRVPLGFDESYNLEVVRNLVDGRGYASDGALYDGVLRPFDVYVSTGPTVLLPVAGAVLLLGEHTWVYHLVPVGAFLVVVATWWRIGSTRAGWSGGAAAVAGLLAIDPTIGRLSAPALMGPGDVLGEYTACAFVLLAALALGRRPGLAGLMLGLAVVTKFMVLAIVPGIAVVLVAWRRGRGSLGPLARLLAGAAAPLAVWQCVKLLVLGGPRAVQSAQEFVTFFLVGGSGVAASSHDHLVDHLVTQARMLTWASLLGLGLAAGLLCFQGVAAWSRRHLSDRARRGRPGWDIGIAALAVSAGTLQTWWLAVASRDVARHALLATLLGLPLLCVLAARWATTSGPSWRPRLAVGASALVCLLIGATLHSVSALRDLRGEQLEQVATARRLATSGPSELMFVGWWQESALKLMADTRTRRAVDGESGWVALTPTMQAWEPRTYRELAAQCTRVDWHRDRTLICWIDSLETPNLTE